MNEEKYPEYYRKPVEYVKGSNYDVPEPFKIGNLSLNTLRAPPKSQNWPAGPFAGPVTLTKKESFFQEFLLKTISFVQTI